MLIGVENEFRVLKDGYLVTNLGDGSKEYDVLRILGRELRRKTTAGVTLIPELDANQGEIIVDAASTIEEVADKLAEVMLLFEETLASFGAQFDENVGISSQLVEMLSTDVYPDLISEENIKKYQGIDHKLKQLGVRRHTNIIGMHLNISHEDRNIAIQNNIAIGEFIINELQKGGYEKLHLSQSRFESYKKVTDALGIAYLPYILEHEMFGDDGEPVDTYTLNRLRKYPNGDLGSELRFPDAITSSNEVHTRLLEIYNLYNSVCFERMS